MSMEARIQYAKTSDGVNIAYQVFGEGPPLVVTPGLLISHAQRHQSPFFLRLAERATVVKYDPRGMGMSQRDRIDFTLDSAILDLEAVVARVGLSRFALFGTVWSADLPLAYAARQPDRVGHLALWWRRPTRQGGPRSTVIEPIIELDWELYTEIVVRLTMGWDSPGASAAAESYRATHSPRSFKAAREVVRSCSPGEFARDITVPTFVLHALNNQADADAAQEMAAEIPGAELAGIPGESYGMYPNAVGIAAILDFINAKATSPDAPIVARTLDTSSFRTILFTDVENHTAMMQRLGDARGREVLREHERITREALFEHGGAEVKTMGDGFMAAFGSTQRALECAVALQKALAGRDGAEEPIRIRIGINAGEPIAEDDDLFGSSVIAAARIANRAQGGEIVVSDVVKQLVAGKGFSFADRGDVMLKGIDDAVRVYEVRWRE
jgi:class 3 adenylate cyclase